LIFNFSFWRSFARKKKTHSGPVQREEIHLHSLVWEEEEENGFASEEWIWRICFRRSLRVFGACDQSRILDFF
jgi:hypothetical protein